jgi:hypothetical protein
MNNLITEIKKEQFVSVIQKFVNKFLNDEDFKNVCEIKVTYNEEDDIFDVFLVLNSKWVKDGESDYVRVLKNRMVSIIKERIYNYLGVRVDVSTYANPC